MTELLTQDTRRHEELSERLSKTIFQSPRAFITAYSEGLINRTNDDVKDIADEIVDIYQNVEFKNRDLVFVSQEEVMTEELLEGLQDWKIITKLKRAITDALEDNSLNSETIKFLPDAAGYVYVDTEDGEDERIISEKFFSNIKALYPIYKRWSSYYDQNPNPEEEQTNEYGEPTSIESVYRFKVEDIVNIEDSFIGEMYQLFQRNS